MAQNKTTSVSMPESIYEEIKTSALKNRRSMSSEIVFRVEAFKQSSLDPTAGQARELADSIKAAR